MNYKWPEFKPKGKRNCLIWLMSGVKVTAQYHVKDECFIGLYNEHANERFNDEVVEWCYAILQKPLSWQAEDVLFHLARNPHNGIGEIEAMQSFATNPRYLQDRIFEELELAKTAIMMNYAKG